MNKLANLKQLHDDALGDTWALVNGDGTGAVVSPTDPRKGVDHPRYWTKDSEFGYKAGDEIYKGGTLICESTRGNHAELIVEMYNTVPKLIHALEALHTAMSYAAGENTANLILREAFGE